MRKVLLSLVMLLFVARLGAAQDVCPYPSQTQPVPLFSDTPISNSYYYFPTQPGDAYNGGVASSGCGSGTGFEAFTTAGAPVVVFPEHLGPAKGGNHIIAPAIANRGCQMFTCVKYQCCAFCGPCGQVCEQWQSDFDNLGTVIFKKTLLAAPTRNYDDLAYASDTANNMTLPLIFLGAESTTPIDNPATGLSVQYVGFGASACVKSGSVNGTVAGICATDSVGSGHNVCYGPLIRVFLFSGQSQQGDSGALAISSDTHQPIGMMVVAGGSGSVAYFVPWSRMATDGGLTFSNPLAAVARAGIEMAQNGEYQTLTDGTLMPVPDRSELLERDKKLRAVCDDPETKKLLKLPHVLRCEPSILKQAGPSGESLPAVGIMIDSENNTESVRRQVPPLLGGYPTEIWPDQMNDFNDGIVHVH